ncbi:HET-domain-containing protein [Macroventuria anomochaeta]|uniref:HET-domain-containing protein n=1 Tax=Macroventuria anomochaeta TaxID=301207 RepID=A0ACB6S131_9PLEO|nr:HET-domain-containing protein [Macroventuria anomochaeta]KAF2627945.1 HET-domain-containing protein [Macroventuria anomochaeta]
MSTQLNSSFLTPSLDRKGHKLNKPAAARREVLCKRLLFFLVCIMAPRDVVGTVPVSSPWRTHNNWQSVGNMRGNWGSSWLIDRSIKTAETYSYAFAVLSLFGLVTTLLAHQHKPLPEWPQLITINSIISLFSLLMGAGIGLVLAGGISQSKWQWFRKLRRIANSGPHKCSITWLCQWELHLPIGQWDLILDCSCRLHVRKHDYRDPRKPTTKNSTVISIPTFNGNHMEACPKCNDSNIVIATGAEIAPNNGSDSLVTVYVLYHLGTNSSKWQAVNCSILPQVNTYAVNITNSVMNETSIESTQILTRCQVLRQYMADSHRLITDAHCEMVSGKTAVRPMVQIRMLRRSSTSTNTMSPRPDTIPVIAFEVSVDRLPVASSHTPPNYMTKGNCSGIKTPPPSGMRSASTGLNSGHRAGKGQSICCNGTTTSTSVSLEGKNGTLTSLANIDSYARQQTKATRCLRSYTSLATLRLVKGGRNGLEDDMIRCSLSHTPIKTAPRYTALSYVWGDATRVSAIVLDGSTFQTTENLYNALVYLSKRDEDVWIWVDALCINQADIHERSRQVALMRTIFRCAAYVLVSLGEHEEGCDAVIDFIEAGAQDETVHWDPSHSSHVKSHGLDASSQLMQGYLARFFSVPWWHRVWTVQEYCVARKVYFRYGDRLISNKTVKSCLDNYWGHRAVCCRGFEDLQKPADGAVSVIECIQRLDLLSVYRRTRYPHHLRVISDFRHRKCFNPLDKIYGILGLLDRSVRDLVRPDYTCSPREVYTGLALAIVASNKSLNMLSFVYGERTQDLTIPTFVPDWTTHVDYRWHGILRTREQEIRHFDASDDSLAKLSSAVPGEATSPGVYVDTVAIVADLDDWKPMLVACRKLAEVDNDTKMMYVDKATAFWNTLCGGLIWDSDSQEDNPGFRSVQGSNFPLYQSWQDAVDTEPPQSSGQNKLYGFQRAVDMASALRKFTVTENGYMGWAPKEVQKGDIVVLLSGGKVPYVLRAVEKQTSAAAGVDDDSASDNRKPQPRLFTFIGDAYIHGVMQGELYDRNKLEVFHLI